MNPTKCTVSNAWLSGIPRTPAAASSVGAAAAIAAWLLVLADVSAVMSLCCCCGSWLTAGVACPSRELPDDDEAPPPPSPPPSAAANAAVVDVVTAVADVCAAGWSCSAKLLLLVEAAEPNLGLYSAAAGFRRACGEHKGVADFGYSQQLLEQLNKERSIHLDLKVYVTFESLDAYAMSCPHTSQPRHELSTYCPRNQPFTTSQPNIYQGLHHP